MKGLGATEVRILDAGGEIDASAFSFSPAADSRKTDFDLSLIEQAQASEPDLFRPPAGFGRVIDIVGSLALLLVFAPVMLIVALLIVTTDPGEVLFRHRRIGREGKTFDCLKFRTMRTDAEKALGEMLGQSPALQREWANTRKIENDPRVTPLGKLLRISSIDELPQLFNVLVGDMSLVGPRPVMRAELASYGRYSRHYLSVRPGLTGMWQVNGRSSTTYRRRVAADVHYVRRRSPWLDLQITLATIPAVIFARGSV